ncbi:MAG: hypothetical protein JW917_00735 [Ignavibacteria bacterium]|nr:hypothetical protein [Ignavibacteria bacterium]
MHKKTSVRINLPDAKGSVMKKTLFFSHINSPGRVNLPDEKREGYEKNTFLLEKKLTRQKKSAG